MKFLEVYFLKDLLEEFVTKFYIYWGIIAFFDLSASFFHRRTQYARPKSEYNDIN